MGNDIVPQRSPLTESGATVDPSGGPLCGTGRRNGARSRRAGRRRGDSPCRRSRSPQRSPLTESGATRAASKAIYCSWPPATEPAHGERGDLVSHCPAGRKLREKPQRSPLTESGATQKVLGDPAPTEVSRNGARSRRAGQQSSHVDRAQHSTGCRNGARSRRAGRPVDVQRLNVDQEAPTEPLTESGATAGRCTSDAVQLAATEPAHGERGDLHRELYVTRSAATEPAHGERGDSGSGPCGRGPAATEPA